MREVARIGLGKFGMGRDVRHLSSWIARSDDRQTVGKEARQAIFRDDNIRIDPEYVSCFALAQYAQRVVPALCRAIGARIDEHSLRMATRQSG